MNRFQELEYKVLMIENNEDDALLIRELLTKIGVSVSNIKRADRLKTGKDYLANETFNVILLDLDLPDSRGLATLDSIGTSEVPVIVLLDQDDEVIANQAMQKGAQDYLVKGQSGAACLCF